MKYHTDRGSESDFDAYKKLIEEVRDVDKQAAEYMEGDEILNLSNYAFGYAPSLIGAIIFYETPQGYEYWMKISRKLEHK